MDYVTNLSDEEAFLDENGVHTILPTLGFQSNTDICYDDAGAWLKEYVAELDLDMNEIDGFEPFSPEALQFAGAFTELLHGRGVFIRDLRKEGASEERDDDFFINEASFKNLPNDEFPRFAMLRPRDPRERAPSPPPQEGFHVNSVVY
eukprot:CAMPEP_0185751826 /NCGR_PEP_ID=MMETSP1174-20130828/10608_1 /TAXON_ID=35687 /ORGANISM="Dictyocha speculum, Strain CCMP1381" /LENGTH=147 /DNA_ID=CAMNT_0028428991 /DNA_START=124 /DNA_END=567 /DNA_ORIENTATION=+